MDGYTVNANDLETFIKHKQQSSNLKKLKIIKDDYSTIDFKYISNLYFNETLNIVNENEEEFGEFNGKVRPCVSSTSTSFLMVHLNSKSISEFGEEIGMSLMTKTTADFHTYEEKWSQWYFEKPEMKICKTVLISCKDSSVSSEQVHIFTELNGKLIDHTNQINKKHKNNILTEGMNYAFIRYLAIIGFEGIIENKIAITINGRLCRTIVRFLQECSLKGKYEVNKVYIPVVIIKRTLYEEKFPKIPNIQWTVLTRSGYIVKHSWGKKTNKELMLKKSMKIKVNGCVYDSINYSNIHNWEQDIRLRSLYLEKVTEMKEKYKNHLKNNNTVKEIVIDYIKEILVVKPVNVLEFSIDYFEKFK